MAFTDVQNFYKNKTILVTGATGFLGKILVEKLLRSCSELDKIIVTMRPKRNKNIEERIINYFEDTLFDTIKTKSPGVLQKVIFMNSEVTKENLGLNNSDYNVVKSSVNILFHSAAAIQLNGPLKEAINCNVLGTKNIIAISKKIVNLECVIFVSTLWSQYNMDYVKENVPNLSSYAPEFLINLIENVDENTLNKISPDLLGLWPITYAMTKHASECLIEKEKHNFPCAIFRAPAIAATYREPFPGWMSKLQGIVIVGWALANGIFQVGMSDTQYNLHLLPVDLVCNALIAVGWYTALHSQNEMKVYNVSSTTNPLIRKRYFDSFINTKYPLERTVWKPAPILLPGSTPRKVFERYLFCYHNIPAYFCDLLLKMFGQKPVLQKTVKQINAVIRVGAWAVIEDMKLENKNVPEVWKKLQSEDKKLFNFDVNSIDWNEYLLILTKGVKQFLKEDFSRLDKCEQQRYLSKCKY